MTHNCQPVLGVPAGATIRPAMDDGLQRLAESVFRQPGPFELCCHHSTHAVSTVNLRKCQKKPARPRGSWSASTAAQRSQAQINRSAKDQRTAGESRLPQYLMQNHKREDRTILGSLVETEE